MNVPTTIRHIIVIDETYDPDEFEDADLEKHAILCINENSLGFNADNHTVHILAEDGTVLALARKKWAQ